MKLLFVVAAVMRAGVTADGDAVLSVVVAVVMARVPPFAVVVAVTEAVTVGCAVVLDVAAAVVETVQSWEVQAPCQMQNAGGQESY